MAKLWSEIAENLKKAIGNPKKKDEDEPEKGKKEDESGDGGDDEEDDDEVEDATPVLKAMAGQIEQLKTSQEAMSKAITSLAEQCGQTASLQKSIGESLLAVMERTEEIARTPEPRRGAVSALETALAKGGRPVISARTAPRHRQFTSADMDEVKDILCKAVADKRLTLLESSKAEMQINKSILNSDFQIDPKFLTILTMGGKTA